MRRIALVIVGALLALSLILTIYSPWLLAWAMVHDLLRPASRPWSSLVGWESEASLITFTPPAGPIRALLVTPRRDRPVAGVVLVHGMIATGEEDWRLRRLAETLAAGGFSVLAPAVPGLKRGAIVEGDIDVVASTLDHLRTKVEGVDPSRVGVVGISVGSGPALAAAARKPKEVAFAGAFGGYFDLAVVLKGLIKAGRSLEADLVTTDRWAFFRANSHLADDPRDRAILLRLASTHPVSRKDRIEAITDRLSPEGRAILELLTTPEPERVEALADAAGPAVERVRRALSPRYFARHLTMRLFLAHGVPDPVIHHSETLRLAAGAPSEAQPTVAMLPTFGHADPRSAETGIMKRLRALWDLHRLIRGLLARRS